MSETEVISAPCTKSWVRNRRHGYWFVSGLILFALGFFITITNGFNMWDESWFLQVVHRITSGEVLYRDIFFGVTPLSVYVTAVFTTIFGTEILVVKAVVVLCFVLTVLLSCRIARQLGSTQDFPFLLVTSLFIYALPSALDVYNPLAHLFLLGCFSATLFWRESKNTENKAAKGKPRPTVALAITGVSAGLCFATKQNLGLYALAALLLTVTIGSRGTQLSKRRLLVIVLLVLVAFLVTSFLVLLPVWFSGGTEKLLDYGFLNKGTYLRFGQVSYLDGLSRLVALLKTANSIENLEDIYQQVLFLLPPLIFIALLVTWLRASLDERGLTATVFLFVGAAFMGVFPRADTPHLTYATPELLLGLAYVWYRMKPGMATHWAHLIQAGLLLWFWIGLSFMFMNTFVKITSGNYQISTLPHLRGVLIGVTQHTKIHTYAKTLIEAADREQLFLLSPQAGFYYLVTGLKNPTPFDYPLVTAFGLNGKAEVIAAISRRQIRVVCLDPQWPSLLRPVLLEHYIQGHMERGRNVGFCTLYHSGP